MRTDFRVARQANDMLTANDMLVCCQANDMLNTPSTLTTHSAPSHLTPQTSTGLAKGRSSFDPVCLNCPPEAKHTTRQISPPAPPLKSHIPKIDQPRRWQVEF
jgi:hypothetical protein